MKTFEFRITDSEDDVPYQLTFQMNERGESHCVLIDPENMEFVPTEDWQWESARRLMLKSLLFAMKVVAVLVLKKDKP